MTLSKKNILILAGLAVGGIGVASMMSDADGEGGISEQIKQRVGRVLGGQPAGEQAGAVYNIPQQPGVTFPEIAAYTDIFGQPIWEAPSRPAAQRGGMTPAQLTAYNIMSGIGRGGGVYTPSKKESATSKIVSIAPAGVAAKGAIQSAAGSEARRISRAGVAGGGAITSFLKDVGAYVVAAPKKISTAGVAGSRSISSAARSVAGGKSVSSSKKTGGLTSKGQATKARVAARRAKVN